MPGVLGLVGLLGGLIVAAACLYYPREIGREDEPVVDVSKLDIPPVHEIIGKLERLRRTRPAPTMPVVAAQAATPSTHPPNAAEPEQAADQPVLIP